MDGLEEGMGLLIKNSTNLQAFHPSRQVMNYMSRDYTSWMDFITGPPNANIPRDGTVQLILILGVYKTAEYVVASYMKGGNSAQFCFPVGQAVAFLASASASTASQIQLTQKWGLQVVQQSAELTSEELDVVKDKTVFIHYYKLKIRPVSGGAESTCQPCWDPVDFILDYILEARLFLASLFTMPALIMISSIQCKDRKWREKVC